MRLYIGLLHYPVYNKNYQKIASAITNMDLHDLARLARTYGVKKLFVITPLEDQQKFAKRLIDHWLTGHGARYNQYRKQALECVEVVSSLDESIKRISGFEEHETTLVATDASRQDGKSVSYSELKGILDSKKPVLLLFGTAWGLHQDAMNKADFILDPIQEDKDYNHLSVRTAAGIILDRLVGRWI